MVMGLRAADLAEFDALRQEINSRLNVSYTLLALDLTALGAGLSVVDHISHILGGLAVASSPLWLFWTDNSAMIQCLGAYIALDLAPRLSQQEGQSVLRWESFWRRLAGSGREASLVIQDPTFEPSSRTIRTSARSDWYTALLFGGTPPVLTSLYVMVSPHDGAGDWLGIALMSTATIVVWAYGVVCFRRFIHLVRAFNAAISALSDSSSLSADIQRANAP